jgi:hypothetical protein
MPNIEITDADFVRLQKLATPFIDTPATTIARVLDFYEENGPVLKTPSTTSSPNGTEYSERTVPPLVHTKVLEADFGGKAPDRMTWDSLVRLALNKTLEKAASARELYRLSGANVVEGKREVDGYKYVPKQGYSYQGVSAEDAVKIISRCARHLGETVKVEFEWRNKDGAHRPGGRGILYLGK